MRRPLRSTNCSGEKGESPSAIGYLIAFAVSRLRVQCAHQVLVSDGKRTVEPIIAGGERVQRLIQDGPGGGHEVYQADTDKLIDQPTLSDHLRRILGFLATARARAVANALKAVFSQMMSA